MTANFGKYRNDKKYAMFYFPSKFEYLNRFHDKLETINKIKSI